MSVLFVILGGLCGEFFTSDRSGLGIKDAPGGIPVTGCRGWYPFLGHSFPGNERRKE
jgi:hypothetical protein